MAKTVCLVVLDGWGLAAPGPGNAVSLANITNMNKFWSEYPHTQLSAAGEAVGLPKGESGNTETGHLNLGAGRVVYQDLARINKAIADGSFYKNSTILETIDHAQKNNSNLHLMGLIGAGGVHSNNEHLFAILKICKDVGFNRVFIHLFTDGRDSPPTSSLTYIDKLVNIINQLEVGTIASVMGRYYGMDRDRRWDRVGRAYLALTKGDAHTAKSIDDAIQVSYSQGKTDEFIEPTLITSPSGTPLALIKDNDAVIYYNFRIDRPRELTAAFIVKDFNNDSLALDFDPYLEKYEKTHLSSRISMKQKVFDRGEPLKNIFFATMTEYSKTLKDAGAKVIFGPEVIDMPLARVISEAKLKQLHMAESEKERFVTYYFDGLQENPFPGETRIIVPSQKVPTYDQRPEMSAREITDKLLEELKDNPEMAFVLVNFANTDMVGHTGSIGPAIKACETVDLCVGRINDYLKGKDAVLLITADHGNVEEMINLKTNKMDTEHSINPVPFIVVSEKLAANPKILPVGILADIAPTILKLLGLPVPPTMTGKNLLEGLTI
jgi:2,3-bisphosphoglycerate-independent phosphoglycerate mutase